MPEPTPTVVPRGTLRLLKVSDIKPSATNPRRLFDKLPIIALKENIRVHGVLVPITVYELPGQKKYAILDGQRRYQCCLELREEGLEIKLPANIVDPPDGMAGVLYMFSIHNFREPWELMPTALSLSTVMEGLGEDDTKRLKEITGLSEPQIERCKILLTFPKEFQDLSLDPEPKTRIPANFWIEMYPLLNACERLLPDVTKRLGRDGITRRLVEKYRAKRIKSVIHFRRVMETLDLAEEAGRLRDDVLDRLRRYIDDVQLETRAAFDEFIADPRRVQGAIKACNDFISSLERFRLEHTTEKGELLTALNNVSDYVEMLLVKLEAFEPPEEQ
jgi:ParB/RepB/Spo0J family partition protein